MAKPSDVIDAMHVFKLMIIQHPDSAIETMIDLMKQLVDSNAILDRYEDEGGK